MLRLFACLFLSISVSFASVLPNWEGFGEDNLNTVDHSEWQLFLDHYLHTDAFGQTFFDYSSVTYSDRESLDAYINALESINPLTLNKLEQKAYWINLYNAVTVQTVLEAYPIKSIRDINSSLNGLIPGDPWSLKLVTLNGIDLSLDDIEHGIVRPKFNDYRVHFALNCAAKGCPNLSKTAYTADNIESLLDEAQTQFINHQRGVRLQGRKLIVSSIFKWYQNDFVDSEDQLTTFLAQYANPKLQAEIKGYKGNIKYEYDWDLNDMSQQK